MSNSEIFDATAFSRALTAAGNEPAACRRVLHKATTALAEDFARGAPVDNLVRRRALLVDRVLQHGWRHHFGDTAPQALVAVGGYGRGELHPGSDIDIQILHQEDDVNRIAAKVSDLLTWAWDAGLELGPSVRTVAQCVEEAGADITVATNLMEARLVAGNGALFHAMGEAVGPDRIWPSPEFFRAKLKEQHCRHRKFNDTAYNLEPNVKEGPGGLRDIQVIGWVAKRHFGARTLHDLVDHGFLSESEFSSLMEGQNFLWRVRFALHIVTGRREDRLLLDHQIVLARQFGYTDGGANLAVEKFMKSYYRTAMALSRLNEMLLQLFEEAILYADDPGEPVAINKRFQSRKGYIEAKNSAIFSRYPFALLEIFLLLQQHPELKGVRAATIRLIRDHRHLIDDAFRADLRNRALFMEILRQGRGITDQLRAMNRYGVLAAYLPAFGRIAGLMQYDLFHVYTVDEHTLTVLRNLRRFTVAEHKHEFPLCSDLMTKHIPKPELLYLGALFHDIAKGRDGDHSQLGAAEALAFCRHHGLGEYDARLVAWLVEHHLVMSVTSQRKDISDPEVLQEFAQAARNPNYLNHLFLLTVADIRGTNPSLWNSWRETLLLELYSGAMRILRLGKGPSADREERLQATRSEARELLRQHGIQQAAVKALWATFTEDYFLRYAADEVAWHTQALAQHHGEPWPLILMRHRMRRGGTEIFIACAADDRLFAATTSTLDQAGLSIVDARITRSTDDVALDTYIVLEANGEAISSAHRIQDIYTKLRHRLRHLDEAPPRPSRRLPRQFKSIAITTEVRFSQDDANQRTVLELTTADRPGLLSQVGQILHECEVRLENARISTFGARVEDVFYVTDRHHRPLREERQLHCLRQQLTTRLGQPAS